MALKLAECSSRNNRAYVESSINGISSQVLISQTGHCGKKESSRIKYKLYEVKHTKTIKMRL
jgi:hypothetical protein